VRCSRERCNFSRVNISALAAHREVFFRGYDQTNADFWLYKEWEREFDEFVAGNNLPHLSLVRLPHDRFGNFATAIDGFNTVDTPDGGQRLCDRAAHRKSSPEQYRVSMTHRHAILPPTPTALRPSTTCI
jgi:hypothetical protein